MSALEKRIQTNGPRPRSAELPVDFRRMAVDVFATHFDEALKAIRKQVGQEAAFQIHGAIFPDEIRLTVTLAHPELANATSVHASCDFDPKASSPKAEDLINASIDAIGSVYQQLTEGLTPSSIDALFGVLDELGEIPFEWTQVEINRIPLFLKVDKANPGLDQMAEDWLAQNDPEYVRAQEEEEEATKEKFVTGPKKGPQFH
jgi:hypothetical protein